MRKTASRYKNPWSSCTFVEVDTGTLALSNFQGLGLGLYPKPNLNLHARSKPNLNSGSPARHSSTHQHDGSQRAKHIHQRSAEADIRCDLQTTGTTRYSADCTVRIDHVDRLTKSTKGDHLLKLNMLSHHTPRLFIGT